MAKSLAHTWGQIVGDMFEGAFYDLLAQAANDAGVYLDFNGNERAADCGVRNRYNRLAWQDERENWHQLDFVYERGGTTAKVGTPVAFVEVAWRRYTKHSKNKAQEIEGAVLPLAETHRHSHPFLGAIVGGVFTENSLVQLRSRGFAVIYVPYDNVVEAFATVGIDARYDEDTEENKYALKLVRFNKLSGAKKSTIRRSIVDSVSDQTKEFTKNLCASIGRKVDRIVIFPLHGEGKELAEVDDAIAFISSYSEIGGTTSGILRYEIEVRFSNGATLRGAFPTKSEAAAFLRSL